VAFCCFFKSIWLRLPHLHLSDIENKVTFLSAAYLSTE
jgi:hypothetical protein